MSLYPLQAHPDQQNMPLYPLQVHAHCTVSRWPVCRSAQGNLIMTLYLIPGTQDMSLYLIPGPEKIQWHRTLQSTHCAVQRITDSTKSTKIIPSTQAKKQQAHFAKNTPSTLCKQRVNQNIWSTVCSAAPSTKPQTDCLPLTRAHTGHFFWLALIYHTCICHGSFT